MAEVGHKNLRPPANTRGRKKMLNSPYFLYICGAAHPLNETSRRHVSSGSSSLAGISKSNVRRTESSWIFCGFNCSNVEQQEAAAWNSSSDRRSCPADQHLPQIPSYLAHLSFRDTRRNIYFPPVAYIGLCTQSACLRMVHT